MKQFIVTHKNGVELVSAVNVGLDVEKITKLWSNDGSGDGPCTVVYEEIKSRRKNVVTYQMDLDLTTIVALFAAAPLAINIDKNNAAFPNSINGNYINSMQNATIRFQNADNSGVEIIFNKGAVGFEKIYALTTDLDTLIGAAVANP